MTTQEIYDELKTEWRPFFTWPREHQVTLEKERSDCNVLELLPDGSTCITNIFYGLQKGKCYKLKNGAEPPPLPLEPAFERRPVERYDGFLRIQCPKIGGKVVFTIVESHEDFCGWEDGNGNVLADHNAVRKDWQKGGKPVAVFYK